ncbi:biotin-dependent carboxyltransferase family protein [Rufibacter glacialis]|uniref:Biotin-dependent carboxyltransferase family protein n=1 Tax=Rufibacter glacialis TaxID=1259555 RepID=A0A5M8QER7_9BACT|nr:biotin-dependent carboxyltransferase family protein [Rufibacter glacialis]KAA6433246.1 biotin-dependent carboxyltransferase family protein [Rufibacter glacialis]GGK76160.1 KipI antagonist [Rufibacter glacialis]
MGFSVEKAGLLTTVQDLGRYGYQKQGMVVSGAMDAFALRVANLLVGNAQNAAALEITLVGPRLLFQQDTLLAVTGADLSPRLDAKPLPMNQPVFVRAGTRLEFGRAVQGCRAYLALGGGVDVPPVMGSAATYLRAAVGGWHGRALQKDDQVPLKGLKPEQLKAWQERLPAPEPFLAAPWGVFPASLPPYAGNPTVRVVPGPEYGLFSSEAQEAFWQSPFQVAPASDRMGYRIAGPALTLKEPVEVLSSAVTFGTVQILANGNPIILMADRQTTGGYPRLGQVISADLPLLAQAKPGATIRFQQVSLAQAQELYYQQERTLAQLASALHLHLKR